MNNYQILIEYKGTNFFGWQYQNNKRTVQGEIQNALKKINNNKEVKIIGSGRTDTGVHAIGQSASFEIEKEWDQNKLKMAINGNLSNDVRIFDCKKKSKTFHARFSAKKRKYIYKCFPGKSVINRGLVWEISEKIKLDILNDCAQYLNGKIDFTTFSKNNPEIKNRFCNVCSCQWINNYPFYIFEIEADRFLHHQVRILVGTMIKVAENIISKNYFIDLLNNKVRNPKIFKAPSYGLYLKKVSY